MTRKSQKRVIFWKRNFVSFFVGGKTSCNIRCWAAKRLPAPGNWAPSVGDVTDWQHSRGEAWRAGPKKGYLALKPPYPQGERMSIRLLKLCCFGLFACSMTAVSAGLQGKRKGHNKDGCGDQWQWKGEKKAQNWIDGPDQGLA